MARIIGEKMSEALGQPVVLDNRGGAGGTVGTRAAAKSAPDGYTILLSYTATMAIGPSIHSAAGYDPRKDLAPIGRIGSAPMVIVAHPSVPAKNRRRADRSDQKGPEPVSVRIGRRRHGRPSRRRVVRPQAQAQDGAHSLQGHRADDDRPARRPHQDVVHQHSGRPRQRRGRQAAGARRWQARSGRAIDAGRADGIRNPGFPATRPACSTASPRPPARRKPIIDRLNKELRAALASPEVLKRLATEGAEAMPSTPEEYAADIDREENDLVDADQVHRPQGQLTKRKRIVPDDRTIGSPTRDCCGR